MQQIKVWENTGEQPTDHYDSLLFGCRLYVIGEQSRNDVTRRQMSNQHCSSPYQNKQSEKTKCRGLPNTILPIKVWQTTLNHSGHLQQATLKHYARDTKCPTVSRPILASLITNAPSSFLFFNKLLCFLWAWRRNDRRSC